MKRLWTDEAKRSVCFQTIAPGVSVAQVARRYAVAVRAPCTFRAVAAAFLMAEFTGIDYSEIVVAALVPALLYYFAIFFQVLCDGWQFLVPFALLIFFILFFGWSAQRAALVSAVAIAALGMALPYRGQRATMLLMGTAWVKAGYGSVELIIIVAGAGIVIGALNATGGGFALTLALVNLGGDNLLPLLLIGALVCIVLGMGMPMLPTGAIKDLPYADLLDVAPAAQLVLAFGRSRPLAANSGQNQETDLPQAN